MMVNGQELCLVNAISRGQFDPICPILAFYQLNQNKQKTGKFTDTLFLSDKVACTLKLQNTPGSLLADQVKQKIGSHIGPDGGVTKIVEMGGSSILSGMGKSDPFKIGGCPFEDKCPISENQSCTDARVVYQFK